MPTSNRIVLVTGATGNQGGATARELLAKGWTVRAMTRSPDSEAAKDLARLGAQVVQGDLDDEASLRRALKGVWGVYALQNTWEAGVEKEEEQGNRLATLAKEAGVTHYVQASVGSAHRKTGIPHFDNKARIEDTVRSLSFPSWVILRPVFFMENLLSPWFKPALDDGKLALGIRPDTKLQMIAVSDIGKYGALAFERAQDLNGTAIDLAGDELTPVEAAGVLGEAMGQEVTHYRVPIEDVRKGSEDFAIMLEWFDRVGYNADIEGNAKRYGIEPTTLREWAEEALVGAS